MSQTYEEIVRHLESNVQSYGAKSFGENNQFIDEGEVFKYYMDMYHDERGRIKLTNRTPIQHQRDKILYSNWIRKQSEKYHVLYRGGQKVVRNYITHTMRMIQVSRAICRSLKLNEDFAEAMVLGSKLGALPFIHASKESVANWMVKKLASIAPPKTDQLPYDFSKSQPPRWVLALNEKNKTGVEKFIPYGRGSGKDIENAYASGKQGCWLLTTDPYTLESRATPFTKELMYGIWRHSLDAKHGQDTFAYEHKIEPNFSNDKSVIHKIDWTDISFEAMVVQYADDITWVIENLNDANNAELMSNENSSGFFIELNRIEGKELPSEIMQGLVVKDTGRIYSFFIDDFIKNSLSILTKDGLEMKQSLKSGSKDFFIGLSSEGNEILERFKKYLTSHIFSENKVIHRKRMLGSIAEGCIDLIYSGKEEYLYRHILKKGKLDVWTSDQVKCALELLDDPIHRIQVSVDIFSELSDQELFSFIGIESL